MLKQDIFVFETGHVEVLPLSPTDTLHRYAGLSRYKPVNYFGIPVTELCRQFNLLTDESRHRWYSLFRAAYGYYWPESPGRFNFFDNGAVTRTSNTFKELIQSVVFDPQDGRLPLAPNNITLRIPAIELYRIATTIPLIEEKMILAPTHPGSVDIHFVQCDVEDFDQDDIALFDIHSRAINGNIWLSVYEAQNIGARIQPLQYAYTNTHFNHTSLSKRVVIADWELLSHSVNSAHLARLSGLIDIVACKPSNYGARVAGAIRALYADRFKQIIRLLPFGTDITHSLDGISFSLPPQFVLPVLREAYKSRLLPSMLSDRQSIPWDRTADIFDALFECNVKGNIETLNDWNNKALSKGAIRV